MSTESEVGLHGLGKALLEVLGQQLPGIALRVVSPQLGQVGQVQPSIDAVNRRRSDLEMEVGTLHGHELGQQLVEGGHIVGHRFS